MQIDVKATERLRGEKPFELAPVCQRCLRRLRKHPGLEQYARFMDWVQYRQSFRGPSIHAPSCPAPLDPAVNAGTEIAIDLRRAGWPRWGSSWRRRSSPAGRRHPASVSRRLDAPAKTAASGPSTPSTGALDLWEKASGREYEQALPGGESDARNVAGARELIHELFSFWDELGRTPRAARRALSLELGVGNGNQARVWLDEFRASTASADATTTAACTTLWATTRRTCSTAPAKPSRTTPSASAASSSTRPSRPKRSAFCATSFPRLHLKRLRQPADRRDRSHRRALVSGQTRAYLPREEAERIASTIRMNAGEVSGAGRPAASPGPRAAVRVLARQLSDARCRRGVLARDLEWITPRRALPTDRGSGHISGCAGR